MQTLATALSPILASLITSFLKVPVPTYFDSRKGLIRVILAVVSIAIAMLSSWLFGSPFDNGLIGIFVDALINFLGATGVFHLANN